MVSKLFIDSDVIIDFFTDREPFLNPASELFALNEKGKIQKSDFFLSFGLDSDRGPSSTALDSGF